MPGSFQLDPTFYAPDGEASATHAPHLYEIGQTNRLAGDDHGGVQLHGGDGG